MSRLLDFGQRGIAAVLIVCTTLMSMGCFTTNTITTPAVYDEQEIEITVTLTLKDIGIISHQNNNGVLYYTVDGLYENSYTNKIEQIGDNFPLSTYSDAVSYKNANSNKFEKTITRTEKQHKRELITPEKTETEREFSPIRTALAIGLPTLGLLTIILSMVFNPPDTSK